MPHGISTPLLTNGSFTLAPSSPCLAQPCAVCAALHATLLIAFMVYFVPTLGPREVTVALRWLNMINAGLSTASTQLRKSNRNYVIGIESNFPGECPG